MTSVVLDASAVLALVFAEPGADSVARRLPHCLISAVNHAEVLTLAIDRGRALDDTTAQLTRLRLSVWPFDAGRRRPPPPCGRPPAPGACPWPTGPASRSRSPATYRS